MLALFSAPGNYISAISSAMTVFGVVLILGGLCVNLASAQRMTAYNSSALNYEKIETRLSLDATAQARSQAAALGADLARARQDGMTLTVEIGRERLARQLIEQELAASQSDCEARLGFVASVAGLPEKPAVEVHRMLADGASRTAAKSLVDALKQAGLSTVDHPFQPPYTIPDGIVVSAVGPKGNGVVKALEDAHIPFRTGSVKPMFGRADLVVTIGAPAPGSGAQAWPFR